MEKYSRKTYLFYSLVALLNIYLAGCLIEIPINTIKVKGDPKYKRIKNKKLEETNNPNEIILVEEGTIKLNSNILFIANIKIGSNNQEFNLLLDTGSSDLWVAGEGSQDSYPLEHHYSPTSSLTSEKTNEEFGILYGTGAVKGYYYKDNIKYIDDKQFNMKFGVANSTALNAGTDGIIGLANYYSDESLSFIRMMKKGGVTDSISFSFKLEGDTTGSQGKMYIGKHDDFSSKNSISCSLIKFNNQYDAYWIAKVDGFSVKTSGNEIKSSKSFGIMFDTGTNGMYLPYDYLNDIRNDLSKVNCSVVAYDESDDQLLCKVSSDGSLPNFRFKINNYYLTIPYNHSYYTEGPNKDYYYSLVFFMKTSKTYIIGSPFFVTFHTLFDGDDGKLSFYSENSEYLEKDGENNENDENENQNGNNGNNENNGSDGSNENELSTLAIILIIFAIIIILAILGFIIYLYTRKRKEKELEDQLPLTKYGFV